MKVAVIGSGFGQYAMAPVYQRLGFEVEVVTPRDAAAVDRAIASNADLISIHSPPFMHYDHVMKALDHGHAVLCDKPFGLSGAEARAMRDRAKGLGVLNTLNFELRCKPPRAKVTDLVKSGAIGEPCHFSQSFFANGLRGRNHTWLNDRELGGGFMGAYATHVIDAMRVIFGSEVKRCGGIARVETKTHPGPDGKPIAATAEDAYSAWFVMENGCTATQDIAFSASVAMPTRVVVLGAEGSIEMINETRIIVRRALPELPGEAMSRDERIRRATRGTEGDEVYDFPPPTGESHEPALVPWLQTVKEALAAGRPLTPSFDDGVRVAEALEMLKTNVVRL